MNRAVSLLLAIWLLLTPATHGSTLSTTEIVANTTSAASACAQWMPIGVCFWLRCSNYSCEVQTSTKVGHYNPDLVVSVYNELGENPWGDMRAVLGEAQRAAAHGLLGALTDIPVDSAGNRTEGSPDHRDHKNLIFRETDVIGHPLSSLTGVVAGAGLMCDSQTTSFFPYFQSALDALVWRSGITEMFYPASVIPGLREIGSWPLQSWGAVYPRTGWTIQAEEPKAAAINAQRAGDIATRTGQPHLYIPVSKTTSADQQVWPPDPLTEKDHRTGIWQMLRPNVESACSVFGENDLVSVSGWGGGKVDTQGDYVWNLWRPYQCCKREGQVFLFSIDWTRYPP